MSFSTLGGCIFRPDNAVPLRRTKNFAEAEVIFRGCAALLFVPLGRWDVVRVEVTARRLQQMTLRSLCRYDLYRDELRWCDSLGRGRTSDIILQPLPGGVPLPQALPRLPHDELRRMVDSLREEMTGIGFTHNNLRPDNIIAGRDGRLHPIRYHYATLGSGCRDDFGPLYELCGGCGSGEV